jgi:hypothetical protein
MNVTYRISVFLILLFLCSKLSFSKTHVVSDYKSISIYLLSTEQIDSLIIEKFPIELSLMEFIKNNTKKQEVVYLKIKHIGSIDTLSNHFAEYSRLEDLVLYDGRCTIDAKPFISGLPNLTSLWLSNLKLTVIGNLFEETSKLRNLKYLNVDFLESKILNLPNNGFDSLVLLQVKGAFKEFDTNIFNYKRINWVVLGDSIEDVNENILQRIEENKINFDIAGGNFPIELVTKARSDFKYVRITYKYPREQSKNKKIRFFWIRWFFSSTW